MVVKARNGSGTAEEISAGDVDSNFIYSKNANMILN